MKITSNRTAVSFVGGAALCIATAAIIGTAGLMGRAQSTDELPSAVKVSCGVDAAAENMPAGTEAAYTTLETVEWKKASINEYEIAEVTAKTTKKTEEPKSEPIDEISMTAVKSASLRKAPNKSSEVLSAVSEGEEVTAFEKTDNGYLKVRYGDKTGYITEESLEETPKPEPVYEEPAVNYGTIAYTDAEFNMLCYVIQSEVGNCSDASKIAVSNVVINRVKSPAFPNSIEGVLTAPDQFTAVWNYYSGSVPPTQNTIDCVRRALSGEDNSGGATYYYAPAYCGGSTASWFETLQLCTVIDGQRYFKSW